MPETMPVDQPVRMVALPAEQAADAPAAAGTAAGQRLAPAAVAKSEVGHAAASAQGQQAVLPEGLALVENGATLPPPGQEAPVVPGQEAPVVIDSLAPIQVGGTAAAAAQPAAGPVPAAHGGGADFSVAAVESIGSGLAITGALAGSARGYAAGFGEPSGGRLEGRAVAGIGPEGPGGDSDGDGDDGGSGPDHGGPGKPDDDSDHGGGDTDGHPDDGDPDDDGSDGGASDDDGPDDDGPDDDGPDDDGHGDPDGPEPAANLRPQAVDDRVVTAEDQPLTLRAADLLANDGDADGGPLRIVAVDGARFGQVTLNDDGSITFTPAADFHGEAAFRYTVDDGRGGSDRAWVRVDVTPVNDAPIATDDRLTTAEDAAIRMPRGFFTGDDIDVDGDTLRIVSVQKAEHGVVELAKNHVVFTPDADFNGEARFTYTISDGHGGLDTATVRIQVTPVNDAPVATCDNVYTSEDTPAVFDERRLSSDDHDVDGDRLKVVSVQDALHGTVTLAEDGTITFTPDADFNGEAGFTYTVSDGKGGFDTAGVTVHVAPVEDAPVLEQTRFRIAENQPAGSVVGQVVAHDADLPGGGRFFYAIVGGNGDELFEIDRRTGEITTTEVLDHEASDRWRLKLLVTDAGGESFEQTVVVRVTDRSEAPTAITLSNAVVAENAAGVVIGQLAAVDPDYGDSHSFAVDDSRFRVTADGVLRLKAGIALDHEAEPGIALQVTATDAAGHSLTRGFTIDVTDVDEAPAGHADLVLTNRTDGGPIEIPDAALLRNDADPEGGPLHIAAVAGEAPVSLDGAGNVVLDPDGPSFTGASLTYDPADAGGQSGAPVTVQVVAITGDVIEGGDADEIILGRDGAVDDLRGGGGGDGRDFLDGGAGKDRLSGGRGQDDLRGGGGDDELLGEQGNDDLRGGAGKDVLDGGLGADLLDGGEGDDVLTGGGGADRFRLANLGGTDRITDFQAGAGGDVIDLRSVLSGVGEASGAALQDWLRIDVAGGDSTISIDADGGGDFAAADARIVVEGVDLMGGAVDQAAAIDSLVANGNVQAQQAA